MKKLVELRTARSKLEEDDVSITDFLKYRGAAMENSRRNRQTSVEGDFVFDLSELNPDKNLVAAWEEFGLSTQDAYPEYHVGIFLTIISHLFQAKMTPSYGTVHNNMWGILLGNSGCGKSVACTLANSLLLEPEIIPFATRITGKMTPESLVLAFSKHDRQFHYINEATGFMKFLKRDYAAELCEDLTNAYDGYTIARTTLKNGPVICQNPNYSGLWNTTLDAWSKHAQTDQFDGGYLVRPFYVVSTRNKDVRRDEALSPESIEMREKIVSDLTTLLKAVGKRVIVFEESEYLTDWKFNLRKELGNGKFSETEKSAYQRVFDQSRKLAMNLTICSAEFAEYVISTTIPEEEPKSEGNVPLTALLPLHYTIPDEIAALACSICEDVFAKNAIRAHKLTYIGDGVCGKIMKALDGGKEIKLSEIGDLVNTHGKRLKEVLGELPVVIVERDTPGNRCKTRWVRIQ